MASTLTDQVDPGFEGASRRDEVVDLQEGLGGMIEVGQAGQSDTKTTMANQTSSWRTPA